jgi:DNA mismatch repair protein MutL
MIEVSTEAPARIKLLSTEIANQVAAGEVIERPASVLKELLENSIDAGATQIAINIQRGGIQLIQVRDNGSGIDKEDLLLALQQHATSKIRTATDLANISSLGFRGEALASIKSVSKLILQSHAANAEHAWSVQDETITPVAHPIGTTIIVRDLFYNLPARRKFLRSERTEFLHLEEVFRRIALSNFSVAFSFKHQDKLLKNLLVCQDSEAQTRRVINLCGHQVMQHALRIDVEQNGLRLWGWIGLPQAARSQEEHQYFFINNRVIRDRLINHALREVYNPLCAPGKMPFYCLYLELDPVALDVNVHPTKHEVRFRDARIVHEFITQALRSSLDVPQAPDHNYYVSARSAHVAHATPIDISYATAPELLLDYPEVLLVRRGADLILINRAMAQQALDMQGTITKNSHELLSKIQLLPQGVIWKAISPADVLNLLK